MKKSLEPQIATSRKFTVDEDRVIDFMGPDARVYATPALVRDIEQTCRDLIFEYADDGKDSVGFKVSIIHKAPTLLGMQVTINATITEIDGARVVFKVTAADGLDEICSGSHERFVVNVEKTKNRLLAKAEKFAKLAGV